MRNFPLLLALGALLTSACAPVRPTSLPPAFYWSVAHVALGIDDPIAAGSSRFTFHGLPRRTASAHLVVGTDTIALHEMDGTWSGTRQRLRADAPHLLDSARLVWFLPQRSFATFLPPPHATSSTPAP